uniref:Cytochrome c oxidase subunit 2 n=1 Tax=Azygia robusta TaxID=3062496 RepID=A0AA50W6Y8_9TREM|nr:cytochrome c oxidase subunit II [Azygia robusta]WMH04204.1 cytochrome c oxidase subunit II [Azygia robusta]WMH04216.1 cytochrome c oxidase subunit II [Azygia robusta]
MIGGYMYYDLVFFVLTLCSFILFWIFWILGWQLCSYRGVVVQPYDSQLVEFMWTFFPTVSVAFLCLLNLQFLAGGEMGSIGGIVKVVGRQWYWSYNHLGCDGYDSIMGDLIDGVDKPLQLVRNHPYYVFVTSSDVVHSFSLPEFNIKVDAIPGRINQFYFFPERLGVFVGYCTELCGAGHAYMPVVLEIVSEE